MLSNKLFKILHLKIFTINNRKSMEPNLWWLSDDLIDLMSSKSLTNMSHFRLLLIIHIIELMLSMQLLVIYLEKFKWRNLYDHYYMVLYRILQHYSWFSWILRWHFSLPNFFIWFFKLWVMSTISFLCILEVLSSLGQFIKKHLIEPFTIITRLTIRLP